MTDREKMLRNYREAERMRTERESREKREAAERMEQETRNAIRRAHNAEGRYQEILRNTTALPDEFMERVVSYMVRKTVEDMVSERHVIDALVTKFMETAIIRMNQYGPNRVEVEIRNDGPHDPPVVTVAIPEFRLTHVLDDLTVRDLTENVGPVVMPDKPIHVMMSDAPSISYKDPDDPVAENTVKVI